MSVAESEAEYTAVAKLVNGILVVIGTVGLLYVASRLLRDWGQSEATHVLRRSHCADLPHPRARDVHLRERRLRSV